MMDRIRLGDILHIKHGYAFKGEYFTDKDTGKLVLTPGNFSLKGGFQNTNKFTSEIDFPEEFILKPGDLIVTMTDLSKEIDTIGYSAIVPNDGKQYLHNQRIGLVTINNSEFDKGFVYWLMRSKHYQRSIANTSNGATVHHTSPDRIYNYQFEIISIDTQRRIASILSAYDNLIENNNKRIRLLEQMAENLYKEWFVRFRFPGHEKAEFENGLPKGWREEIASTVIDVMSGGTPKTEREDYYGGDIPFYTPKDADDSIFVYSTITNITEEGLAHCNSQYYPINTLMITARGTVGKLSLLAVPMAMNQSCFALKFKDSRNPYYLYYSIKNEVAKLKKMANGGVFDTIIVKTFDHIKIIVPADKILGAFDKQVTPILEQIQHLQRQSALLSRQRDLLLPRLMSGKLEVKV